MRHWLPISIGMALALCTSTAWAGANDLVSGVLESRRVASLTCVVINKSGGPLDGIAIMLKRPDGTLIAADLCDGVLHGAACEVTYDIVFPDLDVAAYCHATTPDAFVVGNLRLESSGLTLAESPLKGDVHGKIADLIEQVEWLVGDDD